MKSDQVHVASPTAILLYEFLGTAFVTASYMVNVSGTSALTRAFAYFICFIIAYNVSGAHFNPATSMAVFISERKCKNTGAFVITVMVQYVGAFAGIFLAYLLVQYYITANIPIYPTAGDQYFDTDGTPWFGRLVLQEILQSFTFTLVYLVVKYDESLLNVDRLVKAFCMLFAYLACLSMTQGSGAALNPALGFAQSMFMIGYGN